MAKVAIECPGCQARLNLPDASKLGKKIRCPKCSEAFVAEAAESEDGDDEPSPPNRRQRGGGAGRGVKPKAPAKSAAPAIVGGVAAAVVVAVAGLYFAGVFGGGDPPPPPAVVQPAPVAAPVAATAPPPASPVPSPPPPENPAIRTLGLVWMPEQTELLVHLKVGEAWKAPLLKQLTEMPDATAITGQLQAMAGLAMDDIESVTAGLANLQEAVASGGTSLAGRPDVAGVIRVRRTISLEELSGKVPGATWQDVGPQKILLTQSGPAVLGVWQAEPQTLVLGQVPHLEQLIGKGPRSPASVRPELLFADSSKQLLVIAAPRDLKSLISAVPSGPIPLRTGETEFQESFRAAAIGLSLRGGFDFETTLFMKDAATAQRIKSEFDADLARTEPEFERFKASKPPLVGEILGMVRSNLKSETRQDVLAIVTSVPDSAQPQLEQLPATLMLMAMTGGFGNSAGALPAGLPNTGSGPGPAPGLGRGASSGAIPGAERYAGESAPVPAGNPSQLPPGFELSAITAWPALPGDVANPLPILLAIDFRGEAVDSVCGTGAVTVSSSRFATGGSAKVITGMLPREFTRSLQKPGLLRVLLFLEAPEAPAGTLAEIKGTVPLAIAEDHEDITIADAPKTAKKPLQDPRLKAANVKLIKTSAGAGETMTLSCAKSFAILSPVLVDPADPNRPTIPFLPEIEKTQAVLRATSDAKFADGLELRFRLARGVQLVDVPIEFANLPLPAVTARPAAAPASAGPQTTTTRTAPTSTTPMGTTPMAPPP